MTIQTAVLQREQREYTPKAPESQLQCDRSKFRSRQVVDFPNGFDFMKFRRLQKLPFSSFETPV